MAEGKAPYSGVVHSGGVAGYTGAEGYTGVVPVPGSDCPSDAPISEEGRPLSAEALKAEFGILVAPPRRQSPGAVTGRRVGRTESPSDAAIADPGEAPGQTGPLFDGLSPPPLVAAPPDVEGSPLTDEETKADITEAQAGTDEADGQSNDRANAICRLATSTISAQQRYAARPQSEPRRSLEVAKGFLQGETVALAPLQQLEPVCLDPAEPFPRNLTGPYSDRLKEQAAAAVGSSRPSTLGGAYLQGIGLGLFDAAVETVAGIVESAADPFGNAIRQKAQIMEEIDSRIARGESPWEAANNVLNPVTRFLNQVRLANEIAGRDSGR